jgi:DNA-binding response OmpR family regulator
MFKPFRLNEFRARLDLATRRRETIARINAETRALHQVSNNRITELERELEGK